MIVYALKRFRGHSFDEWFTSSDDDKEQIKAKSLVTRHASTDGWPEADGSQSATRDHTQA